MRKENYLNYLCETVPLTANRNGYSKASNVSMPSVALASYTQGRGLNTHSEHVIHLRYEILTYAAPIGSGAAKKQKQRTSDPEYSPAHRSRSTEYPPSRTSSKTSLQIRGQQTQRPSGCALQYWYHFHLAEP